MPRTPLHALMGGAFNETGSVIMGCRSFDQIYGDQGWVWLDRTAPEYLVVVLQSQAHEPVTKGTGSQLSKAHHGE